MNNTGQVAFFGGLTGTLGGTYNNAAIYRGDGGPLTQIARKAQLAPDGNGTLNTFDKVFVGSAGQVTFGASLFYTIGGTADDYGIFQGGGGPLIQVAREGQIAPDGNGRLSPNTPRSVNDFGQVVFHAQLTGTVAPGTDDAGIFRGDGGLLTQIARRGQTAPDGNGRFSGFAEPVLNDPGQATFIGYLTGTISPSSDFVGIFRGSGGPLTQIVRAGQSAPDGNGIFQSFNEPDINNAGQVAFEATLTNTVGGSTDNWGIFTYDDNVGLRQVVRTRQTLLGRLIIDARLQLQLYGVGNGLNQSGQIAYWFKLVDGYQGIAVWSPTIPGDYSGNGIVDAADYVLWRKNDGTQPGYQTWRANFGSTASGNGSVVANIPEPSPVLAVVLTWAIVLTRAFRPAAADGGRKTTGATSHEHTRRPFQESPNPQG